jgi:predicted RNase H-like nuclease (RuvC/YqgF family)
MAAQVLFNHLAYVDRLTRGGFTPEQARASAAARDTAFSEGVATRSDVETSKHVLQSSIEALEHEISLLKHDMGALQREVGESESRLRIELERDISESEARVRLEIAQSKNETLRWLFGFVIVLIGAIFTIVKFVR